MNELLVGRLAVWLFGWNADSIAVRNDADKVGRCLGFIDLLASYQFTVIP